MSRKETQAKDLQAVLTKDIVTKNAIFSNDSVAELHALFSLYADPRQRRVDIKDILMTAKTLGLDERYDIVFRVLAEISESSGDAVNFEEFLKAITARIVTTFLKFRDPHSAKKEEELTSVCMTSKERESSQSMNSSTSTTNSNTDSPKNKSGKSFTPLEVSMPKPSPSRDSASTFKRSWPAERLPSDDWILCIFENCNDCFLLD